MIFYYLIETLVQLNFVQSILTHIKFYIGPQDLECLQSLKGHNCQIFRNARSAQETSERSRFHHRVIPALAELSRTYVSYSLISLLQYVMNAHTFRALQSYVYSLLLLAYCIVHKYFAERLNSATDNGYEVVKTEECISRVLYRSRQPSRTTCCRCSCIRLFI